MVRIIDDVKGGDANETLGSRRPGPSDSEGAVVEVDDGPLAENRESGSDKTLVLDIHGIPVSGSQLKFNRKTGSAFRPKEHKQRVFTIYEYAQGFVDRWNLEYPVFGKGVALFLEVHFFFPYRDQDYRRIKGVVSSELKPNAPKWVLGKKDLDNMLKPLKDGLKGVIYADDKQIVKYGEIIKQYSESPRTLITVREITDSD
jgi:Holliday junction resolvase RusA-like endonuclease